MKGGYHIKVSLWMLLMKNAAILMHDVSPSFRPILIRRHLQGLSQNLEQTSPHYRLIGVWLTVTVQKDVSAENHMILTFLMKWSKSLKVNSGLFSGDNSVREEKTVTIFQMFSHPEVVTLLLGAHLDWKDAGLKTSVKHPHFRVCGFFTATSTDCLLHMLIVTNWQSTRI